LKGANAAIFVAELENPYPTPPRNKDNFEKYGAEVNLNIPICKYEEDHQCRFLGYVKKIRVKNLKILLEKVLTRQYHFSKIKYFFSRNTPPINS